MKNNNIIEKDGNLIITISKLYSNCRIDKFLRDILYLKQSEICFLSRKKRIKSIDNKNIKYDQLITTIDSNIIILINKKLENIVQLKKKSKKNEQSNKKQIPQDIINIIKKSIIFENNDLICIDKPYGLAVQDGSGLKYSLEDLFQFLSKDQLHIVHRIDKDTSGILLLAKNKNSADKITNFFKERSIKKKYLAILHGKPKNDHGVIKTKIKEHQNDKTFNIMANYDLSIEDGKTAITNFKLLKYNKILNLSLVEFEPITGRKHQLRLHAQYIKCPIVGDEKYSNKNDKNKKLELYAYEIQIPELETIKLNNYLKYLNEKYFNK